MGCVVARVSQIPEGIMHAAAASLAQSLTPEEVLENRLYPHLDRIRAVSVDVAAAVVREAQKLARLTGPNCSYTRVSLILIKSGRRWPPRAAYKIGRGA
jgi:malic enzyme